MADLETKNGSEGGGPDAATRLSGTSVPERVSEGTVSWRDGRGIVLVDTRTPVDNVRRASHHYPTWDLSQRVPAIAQGARAGRLGAKGQMLWNSSTAC